ncbi:hypothetical protein E2C01_010525 [Portunus trituberculatus]|uniref:Uncharacterized protein n=1 Tax=Portunus trituberculatus TaxID=210409 RepID=A0A5B7D8P5_PORTR|nr:hypothetical protein [Portunus trituberculatus]
MNGSVSVIGEGHNGFIYCIANLRLRCHVAWTDPDNTPLPIYTLPDQRMDVGVGKIYVVSGAYPITFASIVSSELSTHLSGPYTCTLAHGTTRYLRYTS